MSRPRSHRFARVSRSRTVGWYALSVLYLVAVVLNVLLALDTRQLWPLVLAGALGVACAGCVLVAVRDNGN